MVFFFFFSGVHLLGTSWGPKLTVVVIGLLSGLHCSSSLATGGLSLTVTVWGLLMSGIHPLGASVGPLLTVTVIELLSRLQWGWLVVWLGWGLWLDTLGTSPSRLTRSVSCLPV